MISFFDHEKVQRIIDSFYMVSGIHSAVFDEKGRGIAWSQNMVRSPLCSLLRRIPAFEQQCMKCDQMACLRCKQTGKGLQYRCHIGLEEFAVPIRSDNDLIIGYIISGQLIPYGQREETLPLVVENCLKYGAEEAVITEAYHRHREVEPPVLDAAFEILQACTAHVWMSRAASVNEGSMAYQISEYISEHPAEDLSTEALSEVLCASRSRLNRLSRECFGMSLQSYVSKLRIDRAKHLLENTDWLIGRIAAEVGIPDYNYFTKVFRNHQGCTPREYRKQYMIDKNN